MSYKQGLNEDEFKKLVKILSQRKEEREEIITIDTVRDSLRELDLSELMVDSDIEEVRKQVNREFKRRQRKNYLIFGLILIILTNPAAAYGGYKLKEFIIARLPGDSAPSQVDNSAELVNLEKQIQELETDKADLEEELKDSEVTKEQLQKQLEKLENKNEAANTSPTTTTSPTTPSSDSSPTTTNSVEIQELVFELQECKKSLTSATTKNITCSLLITSTKENSKVYLYSDNYNGKTRIIGAGKESIAKRVKLGSNSNKYKTIIDNNLTQDIPMEGIISFEGVPQEVEEIEILEIDSYLKSSYYDGAIKAEFRNINLVE